MSTALERSYQELAAEHRHIMALVERLRTITNVVDLSGPLEELHGLLIRHFAHEQFPGGLYESMGAYSPEHHDQLRELVCEHCTLLAAVGVLVERSRTATPHDTLPVSVRRLVEDLERHERREHVLATRLLGASDSRH